MCVFCKVGDSTVINIEAELHGSLASIPAHASSVIVDIPDVIRLQTDDKKLRSVDGASKADAGDKIEELDRLSANGIIDTTVAVKSKSVAASVAGRQSVKPHTLTAAAEVCIPPTMNFTLLLDTIKTRNYLSQ